MLRADPELLGRNLAQITNPQLFENRLLDMFNAQPMHVRVATGPQALPTLPALNVLDSNWSMLGMTGGPNTVVNLICRIAKLGVPVRLVSTSAAASIDPAWFRTHAQNLLGGGDVPAISISSAADPDHPLPIGPRDMFLATHWSTAQQLAAVLPTLPIQQFFYMLQEFEPGFYGWSSNFARAIETYGLDFWPIINQSLLAEFLLAQSFGRLTDPVIRQRAMIFEPAVDAAIFYPAAPTSGDAPLSPGRPKRLLFYARPTNARNMFGLGLTALRQAAADPAFAGWEFLSIGSRGSVPALDLGHGHTLRQAPWMNYAGYGDMLRRADLLLCPMLSPHTSYPVLEMAACGGLAVTNVFASKTAAALAAITPQIIAVPATIAGFAAGLIQGAQLINTCHSRTLSPTLNLPRDWASSLDPIACRLAAVFADLTTAQPPLRAP